MTADAMFKVLRYKKSMDTDKFICYRHGYNHISIQKSTSLVWKHNFIMWTPQEIAAVYQLLKEMGLIL